MCALCACRSSLAYGGGGKFWAQREREDLWELASGQGVPASSFQAGATTGYLLSAICYLLSAICVRGLVSNNFSVALPSGVSVSKRRPPKFMTRSHPSPS